MESNSPFIVVQLSPRKFVVAERECNNVFKPITKPTPRWQEAMGWREHIEVTDTRFYDPAVRAVMLD